jgi:two-component system, sensor histidine kinase and response regulator
MKTALLHNKGRTAEIATVQTKSASALCEKTLQDLKKLGSEIGPLFYPHLLGTFLHDTIKRLAALKSAVASGDLKQLAREAHMLKGASLTIGAEGMADTCGKLEKLGTTQSVADAAEQLEQLEYQFEEVKNEIDKESLIL